MPPKGSKRHAAPLLSTAKRVSLSTKTSKKNPPTPSPPSTPATSESFSDGDSLDPVVLAPKPKPRPELALKASSGRDDGVSLLSPTSKNRQELHDLDMEIKRQTLVGIKAANSAKFRNDDVLVEEDSNGKTIPDDIALALEKPFRGIRPKDLNSIYLNTFDAQNLIWLDRFAPFKAADARDDREIVRSDAGTLATRRNKANLKEYGHSPHAGWSNGFNMYRAIVVRIFGPTYPNLDAAMLFFHDTVCRYSGLVEWPVLLPYAIKFMNDATVKDRYDVNSWGITDNDIMIHCRNQESFSFQIKGSASTRSPASGKDCMFENRASGCINEKCKMRHSKPDKGVPAGKKSKKPKFDDI